MPTDGYCERDKKTGKDWQRLVGNVDLKHDEIIMKCDSAHLFPDRNQVTAFSKIHIEQGDTLDIYGDHLVYDGATTIAVLTGNVELIDKETHLYTNAVTYDVNDEIAQYTDSGRIINGDNTLTSRIGIYYVNTDTFSFQGQRENRQSRLCDDCRYDGLQHGNRDSFLYRSF